MIGKTINYLDLDGNPVVDDFWFHLTKADIAEFGMVYADELQALGFGNEGPDSGFDGLIKKINTTTDKEQLMKLFKILITSTVGIKSADNKTFEKEGGKVASRFMQSDAYSELFLELIGNAGAAAEFVNNVVPKDLAKKTEDKRASISTDNGPAWLREDREPTEMELVKMSREELALAMRHRMSSK